MIGRINKLPAKNDYKNDNSNFCNNDNGIYRGRSFGSSYQDQRKKKYNKEGRYIHNASHSCSRSLEGRMAPLIRHGVKAYEFKKFIEIFAPRNSDRSGSHTIF